MLVQVLSFGTNWWARFGRNADDPHRFTRHAAYYNSTGLRCGNKVRRHWITSGLIRFNGVGDFNPNFPDRALVALSFAPTWATLLAGTGWYLNEKRPILPFPIAT